MATRVADAWGAVVGQEHLVAVLRQAVRDDAVTHAFVLLGDEGLGQRDLARAFAAALNCPNASDGAGCGACDVCERCLRGVHPAVVELEPDGANHVVADVRDVWLPAATLTMTEGHRRVMRIVAADTMNVAAQNALLKLLEEPPPSVVWLLDCQRDTALLPTVLSRCHLLRFSALAADALAQVAIDSDVPAVSTELLVGLSGGSPKRLRELADAELFALRMQAVTLLSELRSAGPVAAFTAAKTLVAAAKKAVTRVKDANALERERLEEAYGVEGRHGFPPGVLTRLNRTHERRERAAQRHALLFFLAQLHSYLRDVALVAAGVDDANVLNGDCVEQLTIDASVLSGADVNAAVAALLRCEDALEANGAAELHLERLFLVLALQLYGK